MKNFVLRTVFGALYVALVVLSIIVVDKCPYIFITLFGFFSIWAVRECHLLFKSGVLRTISGCVLAALMLMVVLSHCPQTTQFLSGLGNLFLILYCVVLIIGIVAEMFVKHTADSTPVNHWGNLLTGQVMVALPFALMINIALNHNPFYLLFLFVIIWLNDTGAYCVGSLIGRHKMIPKVSPGKSWEGLAGGLFFAVAGSMLWQYFGMPTLNIMPVSIIATIVVAAGTLGDLTESLFKRTFEVKDSGVFLPGHGGILDRFDSMLLATAVFSLLLI